MQTSTCSLCAFVWVVCTVLWIVHFSWASFASCCMRASHQSRNVNTSETTNKCVWISVTSAELMRIRQYFVSLTDGVLAFHHMSLRLHTAPTRTRAVNILTYIFLATLCHTSPTHASPYPSFIMYSYAIWPLTCIQTKHHTFSQFEQTGRIRVNSTQFTWLHSRCHLSKRTKRKEQIYQIKK